MSRFIKIADIDRYGHKKNYLINVDSIDSIGPPQHEYCEYNIYIKNHYYCISTDDAYKIFRMIGISL